VTYTVGRSVAAAASTVREKILERASMMLECAAVDLELREGGVVGLKGTDVAVDFAAVSGFSHWAVGGPIIGNDSYMFDGPPFDPKRALLKGVPFSNLGAYVFGAQAAIVEIDETTGKVEVL